MTQVSRQLLNGVSFGMAGKALDKVASNDNDQPLAANDNDAPRAANDNDVVPQAVKPKSSVLADGATVLLQSAVGLLRRISETLDNQLVLEKNQEDQQREDLLERPHVTEPSSPTTDHKPKEEESKGGMAGMAAMIARGIGPALTALIPGILAGAGIAAGVGLAGKGIYDHADDIGSGLNRAEDYVESNVRGAGRRIGDAVSDTWRGIKPLGSNKHLKTLIQASESQGGNPNIIQGGSGQRGRNGFFKPKTVKNLENMTIEQVLSIQDRVDRFDGVKGKGTSTGAAGLYQVIPSTLRMAVKAGVVGRTAKFSRENQEKIGDWLIQRRWRASGGNNARFMEELAKEWSSLPSVIRHPGRSYYSRDRVGHTVGSVRQALVADRQERLAKTQSPASPGTNHQVARRNEQQITQHTEVRRGSDGKEYLMVTPKSKLEARRQVLKAAHNGNPAAIKALTEVNHRNNQSASTTTHNTTVVGSGGKGKQVASATPTPSPGRVGSDPSLGWYFNQKGMG
jgi:hypothetical protein